MTGWYWYTSLLCLKNTGFVHMYGENYLVVTISLMKMINFVSRIFCPERGGGNKGSPSKGT